MADNQTSEVADPDAIVVGVDGSNASRNALRFAIGEAKSLGRSIRVVGAYTVPSVAAATIDVLDVPIDDSAVRSSVTTVLKEAAAEVKAADVPVEAIIEIGDAAGVLVEESKQASLTVVGSRGKGGFAGRLLGTVSSASAGALRMSHDRRAGRVDAGGHGRGQAQFVPSGPQHCAEGPIERSEETDTVPGIDYSGQVVVGVDSLGKESPALWEAAHIAMRRNSPLHIQAVITTTVIGPEWIPSQGDLERLIQEGTDKLEAARAALAEKHPDLDVRWTLFDGQPAEVLVRASDTCDILVIGSRGRGGFAGLLLGSTSQSVLPYSAAPTMVVRVKR